MKFLMWILLASIVVLWLLHQKKLKAAARHGSPFASAAQPSAPKVESMLPCAHCGVHLPVSEALTSADGSLAWCCEDHRRLHPR